MQICTQCNQKIRKLNPHRMDKDKVAMLEILARANDWVAVQAGHGVILNGQIIRAPYRAQAHVSRLVWFGLAEHGARRSGLYKITADGFEFLKGTHAVPKIIWCKDGVVVAEDSTLVTIGSVKDVILDKEYWDNYHMEQSYGTNP
jgi:hypothetical protein